MLTGVNAVDDSRMQVWLQATRPRTLPAAVAPVLVGSALAWHDHCFKAAPAALCLAFALLIQVGTNFANDYYDFAKGADSATRVGPRRAVAAGLVSPTVMKRVMAAVFAAAFVLGLGLVYWGGPWLVLVGVASIACGFAYTGGPFPLGYHGLGDVFVFIFFGLVAVTMTYFVQAGQVSHAAWVVAVPIGLLAANILVMNNYRDVESDAAARKRTLVVRLGRRFARLQFSTSLGVAFVVPLVLWLGYGFSLFVLLPLLLLPMAWLHVVRLSASRAPQQLIALLGDTGKLLALYAVLLAIGIVAGT